MIVTRCFALASLVSLIVTPLAAAQPHAAYRFAGDGFSDGSLEVEPATLRVRARERRDGGETRWSGTAALEGRLLRIARAHTPGLTGALASTAEPLEYEARFDEGFDRASVRVFALGQGGRREVGQATLRAQRESTLARARGDLLALGRREVERLMHERASVDEDLDLGPHASLGLAASVEWLEDRELMPLQRDAGAVWIRTVVEGGPKVDLGASIPLHAAAALHLGFRARASLRYVADEPHARAGDARELARLLAAIPRRALALPFTADAAQALPPGSRRLIEGRGALAFTGGVSFGQRLAELGVIDVGAAATASVTWAVRGDLLLLVERERDGLVRVVWTRGAARTLSAGLRASLGLGADGLEVGGLLAPAVEAIVKEGERTLRVELALGASSTARQELVVEARFDLTEPRARAAFERFVRGDARAAQALAGSGAPGGLRELRTTSTLTDALAFDARLRALRTTVLDHERRTTTLRVEVESLDRTRSASDIFGHARRTRWLWGDDRRLEVEAIDRTVVRADGPIERGARVTFRFERKDRSASRDEVQEDLALARALLGQGATDGLPVPNDARETRLRLEVTLGPAAIERVLAASDEQVLAAYGRAIWEEPRDYTPARIAEIEAVRRVPGDDRSPEERDLAAEYWALQDGRRVVALLAAARVEPSSAARVEAFRRIARTDGFKLRAVVALAALAGRDDARVTLSLAGRRLAFEGSAGAARDLPVH